MFMHMTLVVSCIETLCAQYELLRVSGYGPITPTALMCNLIDGFGANVNHRGGDPVRFTHGSHAAILRVTQSRSHVVPSGSLVLG